MKFKFYVLIFLSLGGLFLYYNNVSKTIIPEDIEYCNKLTHLSLSDIHAEDMSLDSQVNFIHHIQCDIIKYSRHEQIPFGEPREPKNYYEQQRGFCFDRARVIEKALTIAGFETRHVAIFINEDRSKTSILDLRKKVLPSHAVTEVKTKAGWMYVGSNKCFISADSFNKTYSLEELRDKSFSNMNWKFNEEVIDNSFVNANAFYLYGLYSRNGMMFPPYIAVPEININEFISNFIHKY